MISLEINQTKKLILYFALSVLFGIVFFLLWSNLDFLLSLTTQKIPKPRITSMESQNLVVEKPKATFLVEDITLSKTPIVYKTNRRKKLTRDEAIVLASKKSFTDQPSENSNGILSWSKGKETLQINLTAGYLDYFFQYDLNQITQGTKTTLDNALKLFQDFYQSFDLSENFIDFKNPERSSAEAVTSFLSDKDNSEAATIEANVINFTYPFLAKNTQLVEKYPLVAKAQATFIRNNLLISAKIPIVLDSWEEFLEYPGLSKNGVIKEIEGGSATLVNYSPTIHKSSPKSDPISEVSITKLTSVYLHPEEDYQYLIPAYIIEGDCTTTQGGQIKCTFYLPAISSSFFK